MNDIYSLNVTDISGNEQALSHWRGQVLLIVNTASQCGFTPQYQALQKIHQQYQAQGFSVLAFPCNQFGAQEPADNAEIQAFCQTHFQVSFPLFAKIKVNGADAAPLFKQLKAAAPGSLGSRAIKWNFTKFLLRRDGTVFRRYGPLTSPTAISADIEQLLAE